MFHLVRDVQRLIVCLLERTKMNDSYSSRFDFNRRVMLMFGVAASYYPEPAHLVIPFLNKFLRGEFGC